MTWTDSRFGPQIYYTRSLDHGVTWETDRSITPVPSQFAAVAVSASIVHVVYADFRLGNESPKIYYTRSVDNGLHWEVEVPLAESLASWYPSVAVAGSHVLAVWPDNRNGDLSEIYYKESLDDGTSWAPDVRLTDNLSESREPSVAVSGAYVHVVWHDDRDQNWEIYYKRGATGNEGAEEHGETSVSRVFGFAAPSIFSDEITVRFDGRVRGPLKIALYDVLGVPVYGATYGAVPALLSFGDAGVARLAPGVYFLRMDAEGAAETEKLIKWR